jgi:hypothetical protein
MYLWGQEDSLSPQLASQHAARVVPPPPPPGLLTPHALQQLAAMSGAPPLPLQAPQAAHTAAGSYAAGGRGPQNAGSAMSAPWPDVLSVAGDGMQLWQGGAGGDRVPLDAHAGVPDYPPDGLADKGPTFVLQPSPAGLFYGSEYIGPSPLLEPEPSQGCSVGAGAVGLNAQRSEVTSEPSYQQGPDSQTDSQSGIGVNGASLSQLSAPGRGTAVYALFPSQDLAAAAVTAAAAAGQASATPRSQPQAAVEGSAGAPQVGGIWSPAAGSTPRKGPPGRQSLGGGVRVSMAGSRASTAAGSMRPSLTGGPQQSQPRVSMAGDTKGSGPSITQPPVPPIHMGALSPQEEAEVVVAPEPRVQLQLTVFNNTITVTLSVVMVGPGQDSARLASGALHGSPRGAPEDARPAPLRLSLAGTAPEFVPQEQPVLTVTQIQEDFPELSIRAILEILPTQSSSNTTNKKQQAGGFSRGQGGSGPQQPGSGQASSRGNAPFVPAGGGNRRPISGRSRPHQQHPSNGVLNSGRGASSQAGAGGGSGSSRGGYSVLLGGDEEGPGPWAWVEDDLECVLGWQGAAPVTRGCLQLQSEKVFTLAAGDMHTVCLCAATR